MNWNDKVNARGRKLPFVGKSLFQIGKELRPKIDRFIMRRSLIPDTALIDKSAFAWIPALESNWQAIRDEAVRIRTEDIPSLGDISFDHGRIAADRRWKSLFLKGYGYEMTNNCKRAPITTALLRKVPGLVTGCFSVMEAGGHIPRHWGMTKGMLTYHLALKVPADREQCRIAIEDGDTTHVVPWQEGQSFIFDDMRNHEVWNETSEDRYILLIQIKRPCSGLANMLQNLFLFCVGRSRFVQDIRRNIDKPVRPVATPA
ncbi:aspartyl/asparaginyl beta-hydroxylase domain-containing protein [Sphingomonas abietis]|uniref:Aspartyl/asparaginyl beta-hydroxylase domain-containing protein n=1 Tax=Sphingomonas abietis TaxID=3012344 RepID=A0ABY7NI74_9SPHN|nr:aspartyl/asparaginyl beta-hydroxylase domain-containing protein [Sphingomonas abietis]WBO21221.1 aspartyl/asparaginyl beta-hydroxylase domain-containing protein [Sphingomonas abietis]